MNLYLKRFILIGLLLMVCLWQDFLAPVSTPALQGITGIDALMGVPCATNWSRAAPHICAAANIPTFTDLSLNGTCQALDVNAAFGIPTSATYWVIKFQNVVTTNIQFTLYRDAGCTLAIPTVFVWASSSAHIFAPLFSGNMYYRALTNYDGLCGTTACTYNPVLYYD